LGAANNLRLFGWANGGYTCSSRETGLLRVEPRANRFGDALLIDQAAFVLERRLNEEGWSWGFRSEFYMGADAALIHPVNGFGPSHDDRFSTDFRQACFSFHAPILTRLRVDFKFGRHIGKWQSEAELQLIHNVNRRLTLVSETNAGWDTRDPSNRDHLNH
jgi:hypothetical protein